MADANADATSDDEWFGLSPSAKKRNEAEELYQQVKHLVNEEGKYFVALEKLKQAINLLPIERYKRRLQQLEDYIKSENLAPESNELKAEPPKNDIKTATTDPNFMKLSTGLKVRKELYDKLYNYQIEGVNWMHALFLQMEGGILADDMGLGKTVQSIALLSSLLESKAIKHVLIVAPTTLLINWGKEFYKWAPLVKVYKFDGSLTPTKRLHNLKCVQTRGGVLLCTYDLCRSNSENFSICDRRNFVWDYLILDEGHKIKNPTKTTQKIHEVPSRTRLMLTGTPVQNNLRELWSLYDFVMKGTLLGSYATFKTKYEDPILRGRERNASKRDIIKSKKIAEDLRQIYGPYFLRRTKNQVFKGKNSMVTLPRKFDWVIWIQLNEAQIAVYRNFLESDTVKQLILQANMRSCLLHIITLKKICDHPRLLPERVCDEVLRIKRFGDSQLSDSVLNGEDLFAIDNVSDDELIKESGKLAFCLNLLENLKEEGHKTLLFSQSTKMLDIIQQILTHRNWRFSRLDGRVKNMTKRDGIVNAFQTDTTIPLCLLSSQVGGVGLTLTSADRVIIYDPCWNPATDSQAIDRAYRIGQQREVIVYRLITCGTVEEKIYQRQIFKDSITKQTIGAENDPTRYFSNADLRQLFQFSDPRISETFNLVTEMHGNETDCSGRVEVHLQTVKESTSVFNVHDHSKLFSNEEPEVDEEPEVITLIDDEVRSARENLNKECTVTRRILKESGTYSRPFQLFVSDKTCVKKPETYTTPQNPSEIVVIDDSSVDEADCFAIVDNLNDIQIVEYTSTPSQRFTSNIEHRRQMNQDLDFSTIGDHPSSNALVIPTESQSTMENSRDRNFSFKKDSSNEIDNDAPRHTTNAAVNDHHYSVPIGSLSNANFSSQLQNHEVSNHVKDTVSEVFQREVKKEIVRNCDIVCNHNESFDAQTIPLENNENYSQEEDCEMSGKKEEISSEENGKTLEMDQGLCEQHSPHASQILVKTHAKLNQTNVCNGDSEENDFEADEEFVSESNSHLSQQSLGNLQLTQALEETTIKLMSHLENDVRSCSEDITINLKNVLNVLQYPEMVNEYAVDSEIVENSAGDSEAENESDVNTNIEEPYSHNILVNERLNTMIVNTENETQLERDQMTDKLADNSEKESVITKFNVEQVQNLCDKHINGETSRYGIDFAVRPDEELDSEDEDIDDVHSSVYDSDDSLYEVPALLKRDNQSFIKSNEQSESVENSKKSEKCDSESYEAESSICSRLNTITDKVEIFSHTILVNELTKEIENIFKNDPLQTKCNEFFGSKEMYVFQNCDKEITENEVENQTNTFDDRSDFENSDSEMLDDENDYSRSVVDETVEEEELQMDRTIADFLTNLIGDVDVTGCISQEVKECLSAIVDNVDTKDRNDDVKKCLIDLVNNLDLKDKVVQKQEKVNGTIDPDPETEILDEVKITNLLLNVNCNEPCEQLVSQCKNFSFVVDTLHNENDGSSDQCLNEIMEDLKTSVAEITECFGEIENSDKSNDAANESYYSAIATGDLDYGSSINSKFAHSSYRINKETSRNVNVENKELCHNRCEMSENDVEEIMHRENQQDSNESEQSKVISLCVSDIMDNVDLKERSEAVEDCLNEIVEEIDSNEISEIVGEYTRMLLSELNERDRNVDNLENNVVENIRFNNGIHTVEKEKMNIRITVSKRVDDLLDVIEANERNEIIQDCLNDVVNEVNNKAEVRNQIDKLPVNIEANVKDCVNRLVDDVQLCEFSTVNNHLNELLVDILSMETNEVKHCANYVVNKVDNQTEICGQLDKQLVYIETNESVKECVSKLINDVLVCELPSTVNSCGDEFIESIVTEIRDDVVDNCLSSIMDKIDTEERSVIIREQLDNLLESVESKERNESVAKCVRNLVDEVHERKVLIHSKRGSELIEHVAPKKRRASVTEINNRPVHESNFQETKLVLNSDRSVDDSEKYPTPNIKLYEMRFGENDSIIAPFAAYKEATLQEYAVENVSATNLKRKWSHTNSFTNLDATPTDENEFIENLVFADQSTPKRIRLPTFVPSSVTVRKPLRRNNGYDFN